MNNLGSNQTYVPLGKILVKTAILHDYVFTFLMFDEKSNMKNSSFKEINIQMRILINIFVSNLGKDVFVKTN